MDKYPGNIHPYKKLWAIISVDKNGNEGVIALGTSVGPIQAITGDPKVLDMFIALAASKEEIAEAAKRGLRFVIGEFIRTETREIQ